MIYFEMETMRQITDKVKEDTCKDTFIIDNNSFHVISNYLVLRDLNEKYNFIDIINTKKNDEIEFNNEIENLLEDRYFIINFDFDLKTVKKVLKLPYKYTYIKNCLFLGNINNSVELSDEECFSSSLILEDCIMEGKVSFIFDPIYFEANGCKFMNSLDIHDLPDGFVASYSEFKVINLETYMIEKIQLHHCSGTVIKIDFDSYEPECNVFEMEHCDFKDILINSNESVSKVINKKVLLNGCNFENVEIYKLYGKEVLIYDSNIGNVIIVKSIVNQEFIFINQSFNTINLRGTYFTGKTLFDLDFIEDTDMYKTFKYNMTDEDLIYNLESFLRIAINQDNPEIKLRLKYVKAIQKNKVYNKGLHRIFNKVLEFTTGYFTSYKRIITTMIGIIIFFGIIYSIFPKYILINGEFLNVATNNDIVSLLYNSFYFSLTTFTTIVYGDLVPVGIFKLIAGIEGLFGVLTTASLITVFARKFA